MPLATCLVPNWDRAAAVMMKMFYGLKQQLIEDEQVIEEE